MKKMMCIILIITLFMLLMPLAVTGNSSTDVQLINYSKADKVMTDVIPISEDSFRVKDHKSGKITEMSAEDYIFGVVAAEMPALYDIEALKAQAVAAYTYACYKRVENSAKEYDITTDYKINQSYKSYQEALNDWGSNGEKYATKIKSAISCVKGQILYYEGKPILAVYHALSCGQTYSAKQVWGSEIPYLSSAASEGDKLAEKYLQKFSFTEAELQNKLSKFTAKNSKAEIIGEIGRYNSGLVKTVSIYGNSVKGSDIRTALNLPSGNFKIEKLEGGYEFSVYGYGHGVGMSQNGADYMAKQGYDYKQILKHYYKGSVLKTVK